MEFDVRKDGSVRASVGETFEFSVLYWKGRQPWPRAEMLRKSDWLPREEISPVSNGDDRRRRHLNSNVNQISQIMNAARSQRIASSTVSTKKSTSGKSGSTSAGNVAPAKSKSSKKVTARPSNEQVALRAYFIGEHRRTLGIVGDETSDWVAAERELLGELKTK